MNLEDNKKNNSLIFQKQAEEAQKYKLISDEIKKVEAGLYFLRLREIDNEIKLENEINSEAEKKVEIFNDQLKEIQDQIDIDTEKLSPVREKNIEILSKIQRLNLELKSIDEESNRISDEIINIKHSLNTINEDKDREKSVVIDANSNLKRLKEEKSELIEVDLKYYETEKRSNEDLTIIKNKLQTEIDNVKNFIKEGRNNDAITMLDNCKLYIEDYANSYSKNQNIKKESVKRNERIKTIEKEVESWQKLLLKSEDLLNELDVRKK